VKTEFGKFGDVLKRTRDKLNQAANTISEAETRTRQMGRALKAVEALPDPRAQQLLPGLSGEDNAEPRGGAPLA
jgi:DNA recombination protein RmuC